VLTARPRPEEIGDVPHRLYGVLDAADACAAGRWRTLALAEIRAAHEAGRLPVLVGGTGLYLKALIEGIAPTPAVPAARPGTVRAADASTNRRLARRRRVGMRGGYQTT
jgi:tRNA dimethylallyltransferase